MDTRKFFQKWKKTSDGYESKHRSFLWGHCRGVDGVVSVWKGFIPPKTVEAFWGPLWRREGLSSRKPWVHFPLRKTRVVFSILENQRCVSHMKTKECICWLHCSGIVLTMACGIPCVSSDIHWHSIGDCHWDCSGDCPVDVSAAAIAWADFFLSLFSFFFILLYIFLDCCWSACWSACWYPVADNAGSPYFVWFFEGRLLVDLLVEDFVACLLLSVLIMKMEMPTKTRI